MSDGEALKFLWRGKASQKPGRMQATGRGAPGLSAPLLYRPAPEPGRWAGIAHLYRLVEMSDRVKQMLPRIPENSRKAKWAIGIMGMAFIGSLCSAGIGYIPFELYTHGNVDRAVALMLDLYSQSGVGVPTFIWYALIAGLLGLAWRLTEVIKDDFRRMLWRVGMIAILLPPNIFINPPPSFGVALADPQNWGPKPEIIVLPAIVCLTVRSFSGRNRKLKNPRFCLENKAFVNMPPEAAWYAT